MVQVFRKLTTQRAVWLESGREYGRLPVGTLDRRDPWGSEYRVWPEIRNGSGRHSISVVLVLASAGPDRQFETGDDIREESGDLLLRQTP